MGDEDSLASGFLKLTDRYLRNKYLFTGIFYEWITFLDQIIKNS